MDCGVGCGVSSSESMAGVACRGLWCVCVCSKVWKKYRVTIHKSIVVSIVPSYLVWLNFGMPFLYILSFVSVVVVVFGGGGGRMNGFDYTAAA